MNAYVGAFCVHANFTVILLCRFVSHSFVNTRSHSLPSVCILDAFDRNDCCSCECLCVCMFFHSTFTFGNLTHSFQVLGLASLYSSRQLSSFSVLAGCARLCNCCCCLLFQSTVYGGVWRSPLVFWLWNNSLLLDGLFGVYWDWDMF